MQHGVFTALTMKFFAIRDQAPLDGTSESYFKIANTQYKNDNFIRRDIFVRT